MVGEEETPKAFHSKPFFAGNRPLNDDNLFLVLHLERIVDQRIGFVLLHLLGDFGDESNSLDPPI